jgi:4-aminobutyrate aminotransferase-like enzyme
VAVADPGPSGRCAGLSWWLQGRRFQESHQATRRGAQCRDRPSWSGCEQLGRCSSARSPPSRPASSTGLPVYVTEASGGILRDADGNQLIDFGSGIAVTTVGNGNQRIIDAVHRADRPTFTHTCFMVTPYEATCEVCEKLNELTPGDHEKRSALFNSGAEAVENAVKIARHATGRQAVVAFDHGYHGRTNLTMA